MAEAEAEATAEEETSAHAEEQEAHNPEKMPRAEDYFGYDSAGASEAPSVSDECSSEHSEEEYSQDGFIYWRENTSHRGHRERHEDSQEYSGHSVTEEQPVLSGAEANVPLLFGEAAWTDAYEFFKGAHEEVSLPSGAQWLEATTANALAPGQVIPKLRFNNSSRPSWETLEPQTLGYYVVTPETRETVGTP